MSQSEAYYKALERGDASAAYFLRVDPVLLPDDTFRRKLEELKDDLEREREFIDSLTPEQVKFYAETIIPTERKTCSNE